MKARLTAAAFAALLSVAPALAADPFGTAGSFRQSGWAQCDAMHEWMNGACDPAPVDATLEPKARALAHVERGKQLVAIARMEPAQQAAKAAVEADPNSIAALTFLGRLELSLFHRDLAEQALNAGLLIDPRDPALLATRAELLLSKGEKRLALEDISRALEIKPNVFDALWIKARIYRALDQLDRAEEDLGRALEIEPADRHARVMRSQVRLHMGKFEGAIEDTSQVLKEHSDPSAIEVRAIANTALGRHAKALDDLTELLGPPGEPTLAPTTRHYHGLLVQRAILLARLGRKDEIAKDIETLVSMGGQRGLLRMQVHLRKSGFRDVPLDGKRTPLFDDALIACLVNQACANGLSQRT
jgi:tetratricopeptide (TPR) repeat protein